MTLRSTFLGRLWRVVYKTFSTYGEIDGEQRAASFAYYVLFSLFPMLALLLTLGSLFFSSEEIVGNINAVLPLGEGQRRFLWEAVMALENSRGGISTVSIIILVWCSLRFFQALVRGVNRAWHTVEIPWWQVPLKNLLMVGILGSALFAGLLIPAVLQGVGKIFRTAEDFLRENMPFFDFQMAAAILDWSRYVLGGGILFYSFSMLYMLAPRRRVFFRQVWLPALLVTLALQACQVAFVTYLPKFVNYGLYGAVGGMMLVLMWVYFSGILIILGGCLCAAMDSEFGEKPITPSNSEC